MTLALRTPFAALAVGLCLVIGATACGSEGNETKAAADPAEAGPITIDDATIDWPANPSTAAVRMVIRNPTAEADALVGVASPIARSSSVHRSETDADDRAVMTAQERLPIPARSSVTFEPSGLHVMLTGITEDIQVGDEVPLTLTFEEAGDIAATAIVIEPGTAIEESAHGH